MSTEQTTQPSGPDWDEKVRAARAGRDHAVQVYEQTVRDAHAVGNRSATQIARAIDRKDRTVITRILRADPEQPAAVPTLPVVVWLRARSVLWPRMADALHLRGWMAVGSEQQAWYLSRAGAPCIRVDLITQLDSDPVLIQLVQAVEAQPAEEPHYPVKDLLPTSASIMLERQHPEAAEFLVPVQTVEQKWKRLAGGVMARPTRFAEDVPNHGGSMGSYITDEQQVARHIADLLE
ncbi:hypothetical protein [Streptomyces sp. NPDC003832]